MLVNLLYSTLQFTFRYANLFRTKPEHLTRLRVLVEPQQIPLHF